MMRSGPPTFSTPKSPGSRRRRAAHQGAGEAHLNAHDEAHYLEYEAAHELEHNLAHTFEPPQRTVFHRWHDQTAVSYTHLTLPTNREV